MRVVVVNISGRDDSRREAHDHNLVVVLFLLSINESLLPAILRCLPPWFPL